MSHQHFAVLQVERDYACRHQDALEVACEATHATIGSGCRRKAACIPLEHVQQGRP